MHSVKYADVSDKDKIYIRPILYAEDICYSVIIQVLLYFNFSVFCTSVYGLYVPLRISKFPSFWDELRCVMIQEKAEFHCNSNLHQIGQRYKLTRVKSGSTIL